MKKRKARKRKKRKEKEMHIYRAGDPIFLLGGAVADWKAGLAVERDFSVNVPLLASTEQDTIKKRECE